MKETHIAYKIKKDKTGIVCTSSFFEEEHMVDLLKEIRKENSKGIYWVFKQMENEPEEALCIIDCEHHRIYYHYSGHVEDIDSVINKL